MPILNDVQIKLAEQLLISVKEKEAYVYYSELAGRITPPFGYRNLGIHLEQISRVCHELGLPLLSAKIVNKNTKIAGAGFFDLYKFFGIPTKGKPERDLYSEQCD